MYKHKYYHVSQVEWHGSPGAEFLGMTNRVVVKKWPMRKLQKRMCVNSFICRGNRELDISYGDPANRLLRL